jgi:hypothetical protein
MTAPSTYLRQMHEAAARRRLEIAKILRDAPATTNKKLAMALNVSRNTIAQDRTIMFEQLKQQTTNETKAMRAEMVQRLEHLNTELELHRKSGKLPVSVIHEMMLVHRSIIELLGIRKPVVEKLEIKRRTISFSTSIVGDGVLTEPKEFSVIHKQLTMGDDNEAR